VILLLLGPPGSGKGTQARFLEERFGLPAISTGDLLRAECKANTEAGRRACAIVASGGLVNDEIVNWIVAERVGSPACASSGFLLDGYPRTVPQAQAFTALIRRRGLADPIVIHLHVAASVLLQRLTARQQCPQCQRVYNQLSLAPRIAGRCDGDGTALTARDDDREQVTRQRLRVYQEQTAPILEYYGSGVVHKVDGGAEPEQVSLAIERALLSGVGFARHV
jgi:adenylate kinase